MSIYSAILGLAFFLALGTVSNPASALNLEVIKDGVLDVLPIDLNGDDIACDQLVPRLEEYTRMQRSHDRQILSFLNDMSGGLAQWKNALEPLKSAQCQRIPDDAFLEMAAMSADLQALVYMGGRNSETLAELLEPTVPSLPQCVADPAAASGPMTCDEVSDAFNDYGGRLLAHESSLNDLLGSVIQRLNTMYETMSLFDCPDLQNGTLLVLPDAANKVDTLTNTAYDNAEKLANEFDRISVSFQSCQQ